eukprot:scaffold2544_cov269-Chaetoceros_neogracile.AAC.10
MILTRVIPFFVLIAINCHSAIAKDGQQARRPQEWEMKRKSPSKGTNPSKGSKGTNPSKGKATNPSKGKAPNPSKGKAPTVTTSPSKAPTVTTSAPTSCDDDPTFTFTAPKTKKVQDCAYITKNDSKLQQRQENVCGVEEGNGVLVSSKCCAACTAPTGEPSEVPSVSNEPSEVPSVSNEPSEVPSVSNEPSLSPTKSEAPTVTVSPTSCDDDDAFTFTAPKTKKTQDCAYITKNKCKLQQRQDNVCSVEENGVLVSSKCCAACTPCDDDPAFTFTTPNTKKTQDCAYITKNDEKLQQRQDNVCGVEENGVLVSSACCAACTALYPNPCYYDDVSQQYGNDDN